MPALVSIVIPCFNHGRYLGEAVDSALGQTYGDLEVVIVDDGSTDNTADVAGAYGERIRYYRTGNRGQHAARNFGLGKVCGEYFLNLDADNVLKPEFVERTVAEMTRQATPDLGYVYTQREVFGSVESVSRFPEYDVRALKRRNYIDMCSLIRMDVVRRFGFDESFSSGGADYDFYLTLAENGFRGKRLDEVLFRYRVHEDTVTASLRKRYGQRDLMERLIRKHGRLYTPRERREILRSVSDGIVGTIVEARRGDAPLKDRIGALTAMIRHGGSARQVAVQMVYTFCPRGFRRMEDGLSTGRDR